jgi:hypothetical protein
VAANPDAIFGLLAIICWLLLLCAFIAFPIVAVSKNRRGVAVVSAFLLGGVLAGTLMLQITRPEGLSFRESLRAGLPNQGLREYGHSIEHQAEIAICISTYTCVFGGVLCAGAALATMRVLTHRKLA